MSYTLHLYLIFNLFYFNFYIPFTKTNYSNNKKCPNSYYIFLLYVSHQLLSTVLKVQTKLSGLTSSYVVVFGFQVFYMLYILLVRVKKIKFNLSIPFSFNNNNNNTYNNNNQMKITINRFVSIV